MMRGYSFFPTDFLLQGDKTCVEGGDYEVEENIGDKSGI